MGEDEQHIENYQDEKDEVILDTNEVEKNSIELSDVLKLQPVIACLFSFLISKEIYALKSTNKSYLKTMNFWMKHLQTHRELKKALHVSSQYFKEGYTQWTDYRSETTLDNLTKKNDLLHLHFANIGFDFAMSVTPKVQKITVMPKREEVLGYEYTTLTIEATDIGFSGIHKTWKIKHVGHGVAKLMNETKFSIGNEKLRMIYKHEENSFEITNMPTLKNVQSICIVLGPQKTLEHAKANVEINEV